VTTLNIGNIGGASFANLKKLSFDLKEALPFLNAPLGLKKVKVNLSKVKILLIG
jgi:hypothetical protein